ncbi:MAG: arsenical pump-driving ATPase [Gemmatimonadota bacterium]
MLRLLDDPTRYLFFTGKGGVGKTSLATATAIALADRGQRVLLVSTDPASNLGQVLECDVANTIMAVPAVPGLSTIDIDPEAAARAYRERVVGPVRATLPDDVVGQIEEQLSGACTTEIAAFDEFTKLLTDQDLIHAFDYVIFDTAPTGHTLRLLQLPAAWSSFIEENPGGASCLGPLSGLEAQRVQYADAVRSLRDPAGTTLVLVSRPERSALAEADRTSAELSTLGLDNQRLVINGVFEAHDLKDPLASALERRARTALAGISSRLSALPREFVPLRAANVVGTAALRSLFAAPATDTPDFADTTPDTALPPSLGQLVDEIAGEGHGLLLVMGKGGVGKTTIAAAGAVELAARGLSVLLSTTDPAAHVADALGGDVHGLTVSRIDPREETRRYVERVLATKGKELDEDGRHLLEEDLRSPCTEEVAVFHAFSRIVNQARRSVVVLDTAPTGHTLLLLDATGAYHRDVMRTTTVPADRIVTPMMRLRDPEYTRILIVTLPETTPVLEAARLQKDLRRAGIEPFAWIINQSIAAADTSDPLLLARAAAERPLIQRVQDELSGRIAIVPLQAEPPIGPQHLRALVARPMPKARFDG